MISEETRTKWDERIDMLCDEDCDLADSEIDFIDSIHAKRCKGQDLTHRQSKKLGEIFYKKGS